MKIQMKPIGDPKAFRKQMADAVREVAQNALETLKGQLDEALKEIECPEHHEHPYAKIVGSTKRKRLELTGCCDECIALAKDAYQANVDQLNKEIAALYR